MATGDVRIALQHLADAATPQGSRQATPSTPMRAVDPTNPVISIMPSTLKFGVIPCGFYYNLKFSIKNNTLVPMRIKVDIKPAFGEKNTIRIVQLPDLIAPGMSTSITLELSSEHVGMARFVLRVSQNHSDFALAHDVEAHIVSQETFKYVKKSLQMQKRPVHLPNVEAAGPMLGAVNNSVATPITSFSEALIMDDEDINDLLMVPMAPNVYWDPFAKCLRIDPQLGGVVVDKDCSLEASLERTKNQRQQRLDELEEQGFVTLEAMVRLRENREKSGYGDPYSNPDAFDGFDNNSQSDDEADQRSDSEMEGELGTPTGSVKSLASVSSLLALKRERIEMQRRATINAASQFATNSTKGDGLAHSMRTLNIVQNKNKTYAIAEENMIP